MSARRGVLLLAALLAGACGGDPPVERRHFEVDSGGRRVVLRVPAAWIPEPPGEDAARWVVPGEIRQLAARLTLRPLGAEPAAERIDAWRARFTQHPPDNAKLSNLRIPGRHPMRVLEIRGRHVIAGPEQAFVGVIVELPGAPQRLELLGPEQTIDRWQDEFHAVLGSFAARD